MFSNPIFGMEERALKLAEMRAAVISQNIANSDTPNYKARDFDFQKALKQSSVGTQLKATHTGHLGGGSSQTTLNQPMQYRIPNQTRLDNNTVDNEIERKNFIENSLQYQANLGFVQTRYSQLIKAIRGE